jgi:dipeptidyl aminopeptidase/acylaminoacyl peptidase
MVLAAVGSGALIAWGSYRGMHRLLEAGSLSPILAKPQLTGVANLGAVSFLSRDGLRLAGWYVPPREGATVIVTHGAASDRGAMLAEVRLLAAAGFGVLAFDWPGMGESEGCVRWDGPARRALVAAIDWLSSRTEVDAHRIGGLGFSIGGVVLTQVAADDARIRAVVLEAPAANFRDFVHVNSGRWGPFSEWAGRLAIRNSGLLDPSFEPTAVIARISPRAVLIVGGTNDRAVPGPSLGKLYDAAREPKLLWVVEGAGHGDYHAVAATQYTTKLTEFFSSHLRSH